MLPPLAATIFSWIFGGTTSYFSSCIVYCARPLVMPRSVEVTVGRPTRKFGFYAEHGVEWKQRVPGPGKNEDD